MGKIASELLEQNALECLKERMHMFKTVFLDSICVVLFMSFCIHTLCLHVYICV